MASDVEFVEFIIEGLTTAEPVKYKKMFGEYALFYREKVVALICDNQLFIKPTEAGKNFIGKVNEAPPYPGAKNSYLIGDMVEDKDWLSQLICLSEKELPLPKKKTKKSTKTSLQKEKRYQEIFNELKSLLQPYAQSLEITDDKPDSYYLFTRYILKNKKPLFFGAAKINQSSVSYHLMPIYVFPELLKGLSPELKKKQKGKSCFNFKTLDSLKIDELKQLTKTAYQQYQNAQYL